MDGVSQDRGAFEVDDPTQPFSRAKIESLRREAEQRLAPAEAIAESATDDEHGLRRLELPAARSEDDKIEVSGRWIRVSLEALDHIGRSGTPEGMIGAADGSLVCGQIGGDPFDDSDEAIAWHRELRRSRRRRWLGLLTAMTAIALLVWSWRAVWSSRDSWEKAARAPSPTAEAHETERSDSSPTLEPKPDIEQNSGSIVSETNADPQPRAHASRTPKSRAKDPNCAQRRRRAEQALNAGEWTKLEMLAQHHECWALPEDALRLRLEALFQLERYRDCIEVAAQSKSKENKRWAENTCQRAL